MFFSIFVENLVLIKKEIDWTQLRGFFACIFMHDCLPINALYKERAIIQGKSQKNGAIAQGIYHLIFQIVQTLCSRIPFTHPCIIFHAANFKPSLIILAEFNRSNSFECSHEGDSLILVRVWRCQLRFLIYRLIKSGAVQLFIIN